MFREGDVVEIPLPSGRATIGWILHISQRFRDAVGFIVFGIKGHLGNANFDQRPSLDVRGPLYSHIDAIHHYGWKTIAHQPVSESKRLLTKRRVDGGVYVGDDHLGSVDGLDASNVPPMLALGMPLVHKEIEKAFGSRELPTKAPIE
jgi:hypothetical protein